MKKRGFTLIELLVVISIISLLASIVLASLNSARVKARDTRRVADLGQIRTALEFFFDTNGFYPGVGSSGSCTTYPTWDCNGYEYSTGYEAAFATAMSPYITTLPKDPINNVAAPWGVGNLSYAYGNPGRTTQRVQYDLTAQLEDTNNPLRCGVKLYKFYFDNQPWCSAVNDTSPHSRQVYEASVN